jgi:hypothetical protein
MLLSAALGTATLTLILGGSLAKLPGAGLLLERRYRG